MKKLALLAVVAFAFGATSCKKEYTCECTVTVGGVSTTSSTTSGKLSKSDAETWCEGSTTTGSSSYTCKLK